MKINSKLQKFKKRAIDPDAEVDPEAMLAELAEWAPTRARATALVLGDEDEESIMTRPDTQTLSQLSTSIEAIEKDLITRRAAIAVLKLHAQDPTIVAVEIDFSTGDDGYGEMVVRVLVHDDGRRTKSEGIFGHALEAHVSDDDIAALIDPVRRPLLDGRYATEHVLGVAECIAALKTPVTVDMPVLG